MKKLHIILALMYAGMIIFAACSTVPLSGRKQFAPIPSSQMISLGKSSYQEVMNNSQLSDNAQYKDMVSDAGRRVTAAVEEYMSENGMAKQIDGYRWEYHVLEEDILNAWCMPGGKIAFYEGIMPVCQDENGVAVVMGHEIAHAVARHSNERLSQQLAIQLGGLALSEALKKESQTTQQLALAAFGLGAQVGVMLPYSRKHETEADELGLYFMAMAGYDPREAPDFWQRMMEKSQGQGRPPEFLSTHPDPKSRIRKLNRAMDEALKYYSKNDGNQTPVKNKEGKRSTPSLGNQ